MKKISVCVIFCVYFSQIFAQRGNLWVKNYRLSFIPQVTAITQDKQGLLYFAHTEGILVYDGLTWENLTVSFTPIALAYSHTGELWITGKNNITRATLNQARQWQFESIASEEFSQKDFGSFQEIFFKENQVYFYSEKALCSWDGTKLETLFYQEKGELQGWLFLKNEIFLNIPEKGLCQLKGKNLLPLRSDFAEKNIQNFIQLDKDKLLIACDDNLLWTFDGKNFDIYNTYAATYLQDNLLEKIINLSEKDWLIATLVGGVAIVNKRDRSIRHIINQETGLADNEITAIFVDTTGDIWICHSEGISKVFVNLPIYNFSHYPGLEGKPANVFKKKDILYVGTNAGLFYLSRSNKDDVSGQIAYEKQRKLQQLAQEQARQKALQNKQQKKGIQRLLSKLSFSKREEKLKQPKTKILTVVVEANVYSYNNTNFLIEQVPFNFRKITGIESKCKQIIEFQDYLIALTATGLYEVSYGSAKNILEDKTLQYIELSERNPTLLYVCSNKGFFYLQKTTQGWSQPQWLNEVQGITFNCAQYENYLWITGQGKIWKIALSQEGIPTLHKATYTLEKNSTMRIFTRVSGNKLLFFSNKIVLEKQATTLDIFLPSWEYLSYKPSKIALYYAHNQQTWLNYEQEWKALHKIQDLPMQKFLPLFNEVQDIFQESNAYLWVATSSGVFLIHDWGTQKELPVPSIFIKQAEGNNNLLNVEKPIVKSDNEGQSIKLWVAFPFFIGEENTQIQYRLKGLDNEQWSEWRKDPLIEFPFLPNGKYELELRSRNAIGLISSIYSFRFEIQEPFWQTWWFYLIQIGVMIGLLFAAVIYNQRGAESKVASVITLVAIITIFEFFVLLLEPIIDNFVGGVFVFKLLMNILLAISLVPLEKKVRNYLQNSEYLERLARKIGFRKPIGEYFSVNQLKELAKNRRQSS